MNAKTRKYSGSILETYFKQIKMFPLLSFEEEMELSKRVKNGDQAALHSLVNSNLRLVVKISRSYVTTDVHFLDIIQEGNMGLMHAAQKYDYEKNVRFCTYAQWWIRQYILRYLTNKCRIVRLPGKKEEILRKIRRTYNSLCQALMHEPNSGEIAGALGVSVQDIEYIITISNSPLCLESDGSNEEFSCANNFQADYTYSPEQALLQKSSHDRTMCFLDTLEDREKRVITYRFQLDGCGRHSLRNVSDKMGISTETVRQIEMKAMQKIRIHAEDLKNRALLEAM